MSVTILTKEDLEEFKNELIIEMKDILETKNAKRKKWLKTHDVMEWLNVSAGTLQSMRISGKLKYSKIGGILFYDYDHLNDMLEGKSKL